MDRIAIDSTMPGPAGKPSLVRPIVPLLSLRIYPNPTAHSATISYTPVIMGTYTLRLFDSEGNQLQLLQESVTDKVEHSFKIDVATLPNGNAPFSIEVNGEYVAADVLIIMK
jgi:hypothetical protein